MKPSLFLLPNALGVDDVACRRVIGLAVVFLAALLASSVSADTKRETARISVDGWHGAEHRIERSVDASRLRTRGSGNATQAIVSDQDVTPAIITGTSIDNGAFAVERANGIEVGLRGKLRYDDNCDPLNVFNSNGDGTYSFSAGVATDASDSTQCSGSQTAVWAFDWSVNSDFEGATGQNLDDYVYELGMDGDPGLGKDFFTFDLINLPVLPGSANPFFDHDIGDNGTAAGAGVSATSEAEYEDFIANNNVAQNSWRYDFFLDGPLAGFDPAADGRYRIYIAVRDPGTMQVLARTEIDILVGDAPSESDVTPDIIMGSGIENGEFTAGRSNGIEVALRGKLRFNSSGNAESTYNHDGEGNYSFDAGVGPGQSSPTPVWGFDWSVNTDFDGEANQDLDEFDYEMGLDGDPGLGTDFLVFDHINPNPPEVPFWDHAIGDNGTAMSSGSVAANATQYQNLIGANNVAQNSWRYDFFDEPGTALENFDPTVPGRYTIYIEVKDSSNGTVLARTEIDILVGDAPDPADATPHVINGSGIDNGDFTIGRSGGVETALRGKLRFNGNCQAQNIFNNNGDGTYSFDAGVAETSGGSLCDDVATAVWAFDWSVNTNYDDSTSRDLDEFVYEMGFDGDPGFGTDFLVFDPVSPISPDFWDHAIGDNATGPGGGTVAGSATQYQNLIQDNNVAQNSWRYNFFDDPGTALENFDPGEDGRYTIYLEVQETDGTVVSRSEIDILVGDAPASVVVQSLAETGDEPTPTDNDFTRIDNAVQALTNDSEIILQGTFDWSEFYARQSWEDAGWWSLLPDGVSNVTITAASQGSAVIQGPGDLASTPIEMVLGVYGTNPGVEISNLVMEDFDTSIGVFYLDGGVNVYDNLVLTNNIIRMAEDVEDAGTDFQNIGIHYAFGDNIVISDNLIEIPGSADYDGGASVGIQSNTSGGAYEGLLIDGNVVRILDAQDASFPEGIIGIWENGNAHTSNITVSNNTFENVAPGNDPLANEQEGFRVTSQSWASSTVLYQGNSVSGANIGFAWLSFDTYGSDFSGDEPVMFNDNAAVDGNIGVRLDSNGAGVFLDNDFSGNVIGVENITQAGRVSDATCNWWGSADGPSVNGAGSGSAVDGNVLYSPWNTTPTGSCDGFKVTRQSDGAGFNTFSAAIADAGTSDGDTLVSTAASYTENIVVDKQLTLMGAGPAATVIDGNILINADNVTISDLGVINGAPVLGEVSAIYIEDGTSGHTISNTALTGTGASPARGIIFSSGTPGPSNVDVLNSVISGWTTGMYINPGADGILIQGNSISNTVAGIGGDSYANVVIDDNDLFDNGEGIGYSGTGGGPTVTNNDFSNNDSHVLSYGSFVFDVETIEANNSFDRVVLNLTQGDMLPTIQDAIDASNAGDTLMAPAGTYSESIVVNVDNLTLLGEQAGVAPSSRTAGDGNESVIDGQTGDYTVDIQASGFALDGFSVTTTAGVLRGVFETNTVTGSTISNNFAYDFVNAYGISLSAGSTSATVSHNVVSGTFGGIYLSTGANGASITGNVVDGLAAGSGDQGSALTFEGNNTGLTVTDNEFTNNANGLYVFSGFGSDFSSTEVTDNRFVGNANGIDNTNTGSIIAECNWWGDDSGPSGEGPGSGDSISENVDASPWNLEAGGECFGGFPETVYVDDDFAGSAEGDTVSFDHPDLATTVSATFGTDAFADVSDGLSGVTLDGLVFVAEGAYTGGSLTFDRGQDVIGAGSTATLISMNGDVVMQADDAVLSQVQIDGYDSFRIDPTIGTVSNIEIRDNRLLNSVQHGITVDGSDWRILGNTIEGAGLLGIIGGFLENSQNPSYDIDDPGADNILVRGNTVRDNGIFGIKFGYNPGTNVRLLNNSVSGNGSGGVIADADSVSALLGFNSSSDASSALSHANDSSSIFCNQVDEVAAGVSSTVVANNAAAFVGLNAFFDDTVVENGAASGQLDATQNWWETSPMTAGDVATEPQLDTLDAFYESCFPTPELTLDTTLVSPGGSVGLSVIVTKPASIDSSGFDLDLNGVAFDVAIPVDLGASIDSDSCGASIGGSTLSVVDGSLPAGTDSCTIELTLDTSSATVGSYNLQSTVFSSLETGAGDLTGSAELYVGEPDLTLEQTAGVAAGLPQPDGWEYFTANLANDGTDIPENILLWVEVPGIDNAAVIGGATLQLWDPVDGAWEDFGWGGFAAGDFPEMDREAFFLGRAGDMLVGFPIPAGYDESIPLRMNFADGSYQATTSIESFVDGAQNNPGERVYLDQTVTLAEVTLTDLTQVYDGDPKSATVQTQPSGLNVGVTYDGGSVEPVVAGSYTVQATVDEAGVIGQQIDTLTIVPADQTISFPAIADKPVDAAPFAITASASSGLPVSFSVASGPATVSGNEITLVGASPGDTVVVNADQAGNGNWNAAPPVQQSFDVIEGDADSIEAASATAISGQAGQPVGAGDLPTVLVTDSENNPVAGVTVSFSIASGGGSITGASQSTDASGLAQVGSWTLGGQATQTLEAAAPGLTGSPVVFTANADADYDFTISVDDGRSTIEIGERNSYVIVVSNNGSSDAIGAQVSAPLPPELDAGSADWSCAPGGAATCGGPGTGDLSDTADIPSGASVTYVLEADVSGGSGQAIEFEASVLLGAESASGSDTTDVAVTEDAIFSDRFEEATVSNALQFDSAREQTGGRLRIPGGLVGGLPPRVLLTGEDARGHDLFRVRVLRIPGQLLVRLSLRGADGDWHYSGWVSAGSSERMLAVDYDAAEGSLLLSGSGFGASLLMPKSVPAVKRLIPAQDVSLELDY